jgi:type IV secretion system protein VirB9
MDSACTCAPNKLRAPEIAAPADQLIKVWCKFIFFGLLTLAIFSSENAWSFMPVATDSRIKTLVYNENDVFHIVVHYGYQSSIEFAKNEEIQTLSLGNSFAWKYSTVGRRLFLSALEGAAHTNMTVITSKRTYQFDLESKDPSAGVDDELVYVVRFFYPDSSFDAPAPKVDTKKFLPEPIAATIAPAKQKHNNFNYSLTGPDSIAPIKVFDDGSTTFLQFKNNNADIPNIFIVQDDGSEARVSYSRSGEYIAIKKLVKKLALRLQKDLVYVYNDGAGNH